MDGLLGLLVVVGVVVVLGLWVVGVYNGLIRRRLRRPQRRVPLPCV